MKNKVQKILVWFANSMMQIPEYQPQWTAEFCVKEALENRAKIKRELLSKIDFSALSLEDFLDLGFSFWDESKSLLLCPLWLADTLFPEEDHDHRGGLIAYGFKVVNGKVLFEKSGI
jgi:hypothetical protein